MLIYYHLMNGLDCLDEPIVEHYIAVSECIKLACRKPFGGVEIHVLEVWNAKWRHSREFDYMPTEKCGHVNQYLYDTRALCRTKRSTR